MISYSEGTDPKNMFDSKTGSLIDLRTVSIKRLVFRELCSFQFPEFRSINSIRGGTFRVVSQGEVYIKGFGVTCWSVGNEIGSDLRKINTCFIE